MCLNELFCFSDVLNYRDLKINVENLALYEKEIDNTTTHNNW